MSHPRSPAPPRTDSALPRSFPPALRPLLGDSDSDSDGAARAPQAALGTHIDPAASVDAIDQPLVDLIALFRGPLADVSFPEVDHATLAELATGVRLAAAEVEAARDALEAREQALEDARRSLLARGQRALAYARVYADGNAELRAVLDRLGPLTTSPAIATASSRLSRSKRSTEPEPVADHTPKRRGRPRAANDTLLLSNAGLPPHASQPESVPADASAEVLAS